MSGTMQGMKDHVESTCQSCPVDCFIPFPDDKGAIQRGKGLAQAHTHVRQKLHHEPQSSSFPSHHAAPFSLWLSHLPTIRGSQRHWLWELQLVFIPWTPSPNRDGQLSACWPVPSPWTFRTLYLPGSPSPKFDPCLVTSCLLPKRTRRRWKNKCRPRPEISDKSKVQT